MEQHFCGCHEAMEYRVAPWRKRRLTWRVQGRLPQLGDQAVRAAFLEATASIASACGLSFAEADDPRACDILVTTGVIDRPGGVLAWSELPDGSDRQLLQKYDTSERFVVAISPARGTIDLVAVACHELGHAVGLEHAPQGSPDLMAPVYEPGRRTPQPGDIRRLAALYGPPAPPASPPGDSRRTAWAVYLDQHGQQLAKFRMEQVE